MKMNFQNFRNFQNFGPPGRRLKIFEYFFFYIFWGIQGLKLNTNPPGPKDLATSSAKGVTLLYSQLFFGAPDLSEGPPSGGPLRKVP